ncbi:Hypothetical protein PHPALM_17445 [Phytophthora palmivora]|uniref:N-acetyltransferase domain-containing protein n=1 Tax=Phytophthora palmivora TaxID=4796 RepID=A0A2P4XM83_9STRA|nr:Hypothetical protein PHPALM_17445 [Phytophthora palmivora]
MTSLEARSTRVDEFGQVIGFTLENWTPPPIPPHKSLLGRYCHLEPLKVEPHAREIWDAQANDPEGASWTYMPFGPFANFDEFKQWGVDQHALGFVAYTSIRPSHGVLEVGVYYSPRLTKTRAATEAMYLAISNAFDLGYRRFEWKCDSCNMPSRAAATRFGFTYEGLFRQALVHNGRNRDTTWFSIIDQDWNDGLNDSYERWLDLRNFDDAGQQKLRLSQLTAPFVHARP